MASDSSSSSPSTPDVVLPAHYPSSFPKPPASFTVTESDFRTSDGLRLHKKLYIPVKPPIATITLVHGFGEHKDRYILWIALFADAGYIVQAYDHRGHGVSEGPRGHVPTLDHLVEDLALVVAQADKSLPHFLYGHSLGGGTVLSYLIKYPGTVTGALVTDPLIKLSIAVPKWKEFAARWVSRIVPTFVLGNELKPELLTHDLDVVKSYAADPLIFSVVSAAAGSIFFDMGDGHIIPNAHKIVDPILLVHGTADQVTSQAATEQVYQLITSPDKTLALKEGWFHEPHNEIGKEAAFAEFVAWFNHRVPGLTATTTSNT